VMLNVVTPRHTWPKEVLNRHRSQAKEE